MNSFSLATPDPQVNNRTSLLEQPSREGLTLTQQSHGIATTTDLQDMPRTLPQTDKSSAIYRRFDRLAHRVLLFYEAKLSELEKQLDHLDQEDAGKEELQQAAKACEILEDNYLGNAEANNEEVRRWLQRKATRRLQVIAEIQKTLKSYCKSFV